MDSQSYPYYYLGGSLGALEYWYSITELYGAWIYRRSDTLAWYWRIGSMLSFDGG